MPRDHARRAAGLLVWLGVAAAIAGLIGASPAIAQPDAPDTGQTDTTGGDEDEDGASSCGQGPGVPAEIGDLCGASGSTAVPVVETQLGLFESAAVTFWKQLIDWFAAGMQMLLDALVHAANTTTRIDLTADWFVEQYYGVLRIGGLVMLPLFLAAMIRGLVVERAELTRAVTRLPLAALLTVVALPAGQFFVATVDALSSGYEAGLGASVEEFAQLLGDAAEPLISTSAIAGGTSGSAATLSGTAFGFVLLAALMVFASFVVWIELVLRQAGVYLLVLFLPLAFAGLVWTPTRSWLAKMVQGFVALVVSKFVIVVVLSTALAALRAMASDWLVLSGGSTPTGNPNLTGATPFELLAVLALGVALIGLAAFAPYTVWRLIPVAMAQTSGTFEGVLRRGTAAVGRPRPVDATYNRVAQIDRARLLTDRLTPGGTSSLVRGGATSRGAAGGSRAAAGAGGAAAAGPAAAAAAAVAVAGKATKTARRSASTLPDRAEGSS